MAADSRAQIAFVRTSTSSPRASATNSAAPSSPNTDRVPRALNAKRPVPRRPFVWLHRNIGDSRTGCAAHTFAADVVFRRQHSVMTLGYMRRQPEIDYSGSCVGHAERKRNVKKILLTTTALIVLGIAPAAAADLAARPYTKAPPMAVAYNWSGFYAGINGGWGSSRQNWGETRLGVARSGGSPDANRGHPWWSSW